MRRGKRNITTLFALMFCGIVISKSAAAAVYRGTLPPSIDDVNKKVQFTAVFYSSSYEKYGGNIETLKNGKLVDYTHKMFSGSGYMYLQGAVVPFNTGDSVTAHGYLDAK